MSVSFFFFFPLFSFDDLSKQCICAMEESINFLRAQHLHFWPANLGQPDFIDSFTTNFFVIVAIVVSRNLDLDCFGVGG